MPVELLPAGAEPQPRRQAGALDLTGVAGSAYGGRRLPEVAPTIVGQRSSSTPRGRSGAHYRKTHTLLAAEAADLRAVSSGRARIEAELAAITTAQAAAAAAVLAGELMARVAAAGLLPLHVRVARDGTGASIEVGWRSGPGYLAASLEQWWPRDGTDYALALITELADAYGVEIAPSRGGYLWCHVPVPDRREPPADDRPDVPVGHKRLPDTPPSAAPHTGGPTHG